MDPREVSDWNLDTLHALPKSSRYESVWLGFKKLLPDRRDRAGKERLAKTCASFANSSGGFLVFGVRDQRVRPIDKRLIELDAPLDFPAWRLPLWASAKIGFHASASNGSWTSGLTFAGTWPTLPCSSRNRCR